MAALATKDDLKAMLNIQHAQDDALLDRLLSSASDYFERQAGRTITATDYVEVQDGGGGRTIIPANYPVISVTSVELNGETLDESTGYDVCGYFLSSNVLKLRGSFVSEGTGNVVLTYRAGYETTPPDVVQAVLEIAALMYRERERVGQQSRSGPDGNTVFYYAPPARVVSTIEAYRRIA